MMNSVELAHQFRRISIDSNASSVPQPPEMLSACTTALNSQDFELDSSVFDNMSQSSSFNSLSSQSSRSSIAGGLSRSRCVANNLSALGSASAADYSGRTTERRQLSTSSYTTDGWGYFADTR